ncbi:MAG TPA: 2'-deoxycytidine 5'-triphosphate deaminase [Xanthobacteraceae bacterium]|nr:2'-deoxycytidine 5'-triphosphate deaminase [Xanthobacteraceae bacterium]
MEYSRRALRTGLLSSLARGPTVGRLAYENMLARPDTLRGQGIGSNDQAQGLKLSKHFRARSRKGLLKA